MINFIPDYPSAADVRSGVAFGDFGELTGTLSPGIDGEPPVPAGLGMLVIEKPTGVAYG